MMGDCMLPLPEPILNGIRISHAELRAIHVNMRIAISAATKLHCLDGPRLLSKADGEGYELKAHERDRDGCLLASVVVWSGRGGWKYTRRIRLVPVENTDLSLKVEVAREERGFHTK
jgi:hypothetical protein